MERINIIGFPGAIGGASTELGHFVELMKDKIPIRLLIPGKAPNEIPGVEILDNLISPAGVCSKGEIVIGFCNADFLNNAEKMFDRGLKTVWVNCMNWIHAKEKILYDQTKRHFDGYVYQSKFQFSQLNPAYSNQSKHAVIRGAFVPEKFRRKVVDVNQKTFNIGRAARPDLDKWSSNLLNIWNRCNYPNKFGFAMGVDDKVQMKLGKVPEFVSLLRPCCMPIQKFYDLIDVCCPVNGGAKENWPQVGLESMASKIPLVVENAWGWREMVKHGETGFLCDNDFDFGHYLTLLARDRELLRTIANNAYDYLQSELLAGISEQWLEFLSAL